MHTKTVQRRRGDERGAAAVEFALVGVLLFTLLFGILQFGMWFWAWQAGGHAAREAARVAAVNPCNTGGAVNVSPGATLLISDGALVAGGTADPFTDTLADPPRHAGTRSIGPARSAAATGWADETGSAGPAA